MTERTPHLSIFFFFNDTATTEIYTLSLHDALPICSTCASPPWVRAPSPPGTSASSRSEEHTSELQSRVDLVCRLLLEKKKNKGVTLALCKKKIKEINRHVTYSEY